jgi:hypothetical protein
VSSYSANSSNCVEVRLADTDREVEVQDTKHRGPTLSFPAGAFAAFVLRVTE